MNVIIYIPITDQGLSYIQNVLEAATTIVGKYGIC